jgi:hypothetical protein
MLREWNQQWDRDGLLQSGEWNSELVRLTSVKDTQSD